MYPAGKVTEYFTSAPVALEKKHPDSVTVVVLGREKSTGAQVSLAREWMDETKRLKQNRKQKIKVGTRVPVERKKLFFLE